MVLSRIKEAFTPPEAQSPTPTGVTCGSLKIVAPFDPSDVTADGCTVDSEVSEGGSVSLTATVNNPSEQSGQVDILWQAGGKQIASKTVTASPGSSSVNATVDWGTLVGKYGEGSQIDVNAKAVAP